MDELVAKIIAYEDGTMPEDEVVPFFQEIIDNGMVWGFHGFYGRTAMDLIESGVCHNTNNTGG